MKILLSFLYGACILAANWSLSHWGFVPLFGITAIMVPAGIYAAGLTFGFRDALQEAGGKRWVVGSIIGGAALSWFIEPRFALASGAAFLLSELADLAVYTPLRERHWVGAVMASNAVGSVIDSMLFLAIAFSSISGWFDLTIGKFAMTAVTLPVVWWVRKRK